MHEPMTFSGGMLKRKIYEKEGECENLRLQELEGLKKRRTKKVKCRPKGGKCRGKKGL
jgi:hypothetical protein